MQDEKKKDKTLEGYDITTENFSKYTQVNFGHTQWLSITQNGVKHWRGQHYEDISTMRVECSLQI